MVYLGTMVKQVKSLSILALGFILVLFLVILFSFKLINAGPLDTGVSTPGTTSVLSFIGTNQIILEANSPENTVYNLYTEYFDCLKDHFNNPNGRSPDETCSLSDDKYLDSKLLTKFEQNRINLICAQEIPVDFTVDKAQIIDNQASTTVHTYYSDSGENPIKVRLQNTNNTWKITDVVCAY